MEELGKPKDKVKTKTEEGKGKEGRGKLYDFTDWMGMADGWVDARQTQVISTDYSKYVHTVQLYLSKDEERDKRISREKKKVDAYVTNIYTFLSRTAIRLRATVCTPCARA